MNKEVKNSITNQSQKQVIHKNSKFAHLHEHNIHMSPKTPKILSKISFNGKYFDNQIKNPIDFGINNPTLKNIEQESMPIINSQPNLEIKFPIQIDNTIKRNIPIAQPLENNESNFLNRRF